MYRTDLWTLWEKARVGWSERTASKHVYYQVWNRSPVQVGCMRQVPRADALGRPRGMEWGGKWERGSRWGTHVNPWLIHVNVWQKPLQYCKVISLQLIKIIGGEKKVECYSSNSTLPSQDFTRFAVICVSIQILKLLVLLCEKYLWIHFKSLDCLWHYCHLNSINSSKSWMQ